MARLVAALTAFSMMLPLVAAHTAPPVVAYEVPTEPGIQTTVWATGLNRPWGIDWLPDGRALVTERNGSLRILNKDGTFGEPVSGVPTVATVGQGGLLDVALHPKFAENGWVYLTHAIGDSKANQTALSRGRLVGNSLQDLTEIFRNPITKNGGAHFGSRLLWLPDGSLLMSVGDGGNSNIKLNGENIRNQAQNPTTYFGKVLRLDANGLAAKGNLANQKKGWDARVWTIGHRNTQGLALDSKTGAIWQTEHGAKGGDELNLLRPGTNYGWPLVTYSVEYTGQPITEERSRPGMADPISVWVPSISPSGLAVYRGAAFPSLDGAILAGGMMSRDVRVVRAQPSAQAKPIETRIRLDVRVRDVAVGPDGLIYVLVDEEQGQILRLSPKAAQ